MEDKTKLHSDALEKVFEKLLFLQHAKGLDVNHEGEGKENADSKALIKPMLLSKRCSNAFGHTFRVNCQVCMYNEGGWMRFREGAPLGKCGEFIQKRGDKWLALWMLKKGLFKWIDIEIFKRPDTLTLTQVEINEKESPLESFARLVFTNGDEGFSSLKVESLVERVKLPMVENCSIVYVHQPSPQSYEVSWTTLNRMFNLDPKKLLLTSGFSEMDFVGPPLKASILASATKEVRYRKFFRSTSDDFESFERISPWKMLLLHTCNVCPNLEQLEFMFSWALPNNERPLDPYHFEQMEQFIDWAYDELLPAMPDDSRFDLCFHCPQDTFIGRLEELAGQMKFVPIDNEGGYRLKMRSTDDPRFEINC